MTDDCCNVYRLCTFCSLVKVFKINHVLRSERSILVKEFVSVQFSFDV